MVELGLKDLKYQLLSQAMTYHKSFKLPTRNSGLQGMDGAGPQTVRGHRITSSACGVIAERTEHYTSMTGNITDHHKSRDVRKPDFCICENKDADQLHGNREADQHLCFRYTDSTIPLLSKSEISNL